jgi:hypothetical protein
LRIADSPVPCDWREPTLGRGFCLYRLYRLHRNSGATVVNENYGEEI